jgi:hypothetical protein
MGDPTLRTFMVAPPTNVRATAADKVTIQWDASADPVAGYFIYRGTNFDSGFQKLNTDPLVGNEFDDAPAAGHYVYMVKAVALQTTGSGTFWNLSEGAFVQTDVAAKIDPVILHPKFTDTATFEFTASGWPGRSYTIQSRTPDGNWSIRATGVAGDNGSVSYREQIDPAAACEFYRVVWE